MKAYPMIQPMEAPLGTVMNQNPEQVLSFKLLIMTTNETSLRLLNSVKDSKEVIVGGPPVIQSKDKLLQVRQPES
jgi:hypothetical protein